jgi:hypothetical protein
VREHRTRNPSPLDIGTRGKCLREVTKSNPLVEAIDERYQAAESPAASANDGQWHESQAAADGLHKGKLDAMPHTRSRSHDVNRSAGSIAAVIGKTAQPATPTSVEDG